MSSSPSFLLRLLSGNAKGARRRLREGWGVSALLVNNQGVL